MSICGDPDCSMCVPSCQDCAVYEERNSYEARLENYTRKQRNRQVGSFSEDEQRCWFVYNRPVVVKMLASEKQGKSGKLG